MNSKARRPISQPVHTNAPSQLELEQSAELRTYLEGLGLYESPEEATKRQEILGLMDRICKDWVRKVCVTIGKENVSVVFFRALLSPSQPLPLPLPLNRFLSLDHSQPLSPLSFSTATSLNRYGRSLCC